MDLCGCDAGSRSCVAVRLRDAFEPCAANSSRATVLEEPPARDGRCVTVDAHRVGVFAVGSDAHRERAHLGPGEDLVDVTAASGTLPSLSVDVETSYDGSAWRTLGGFTAKAGTGSERLSFSGCDRFVRCAYTISGTLPEFTFSVSGEAV